MRISVFGLGYVGTVSCACLADLGHEVIGVDINPEKVRMICEGSSPVVEERVDDLIKIGVETGKLRATLDAEFAVINTEISMISVATPANADFTPNLKALENVVRDIGMILHGRKKHHTIILRSTVYPGTTEEVIKEILEKSAGRSIGDDLSLVFNPEFLREGSAVADFLNPPQTIVGSIDKHGYQVLRDIYENIPGEFVETSCGIAEAVKYLCNVFHALKIVFANESGSILKTMGLDSREVMKIFCQDRQLNISSAYLRPGFAFGGSCLPKEVKGFLNLAVKKGISIPTLIGLLDSNDAHILRAFDMIAKSGRCKVALFGLAFKPGTDDMRDSPLVVLAEKLIGKGYELSIYDKYVKLSRLLGKNRDYIDKEIPHLDRLIFENVEDVMLDAEVIVVGHADAFAREKIISLSRGRRIIDLAGYADLQAAETIEYDGICW